MRRFGLSILTVLFPALNVGTAMCVNVTQLFTMCCRTKC